MPLPCCPACGGAQPSPGRAPQPLRLESRPKAYTADGGHRVATPAQTIERYGHHVSPFTGIAAALERHDLGAAGAVYVAGYNKVFGNHTIGDLRTHFRSRSSGKGVSDAQAQAGALCESIERYSGHYQGNEMRRRTTLCNLGSAAIDPRSCTLYSERQYREREQRNARPSRYNSIPEPFDDHAEIEWSPLWSLTHGAPRWLPTALLYFGYPQERAQSCFHADSNGNAAGNSREEAIVHGFLELVERDALAIWWYNRLPVPGVALDSFDEPFVGRIRTHLAAQGRDLWVLDLSCDTGVPVFGAFSRSLRGDGERIAMGFGAHVEPRLALLRALTELQQMLIWLPLSAAAPEGVLRDPETVAWMREASIEHEPYLAPCGVRQAGDFAYEPLDDLLDEIDGFVDLTRRLGLELLVLDQTRAEIGMPVVKVVVPGLRPAHARFAPGRLYQVPVASGQRGRPIDEGQLNPRAVFL